MNWFFITIGTVLVLILSAAVVGPQFIDWTAHRHTIEATAERFLGLDVTIDGEADLRLLPSPRLELTNVRLGGQNAPLMEADSVALDVDLAPLLRGELKVLDISLGEPVVQLRIGEDGGLRMPDFAAARSLGGFFDAADVSVETVAVDGLSAIVSDERTGERLRIEDVNLTGAARSLRGPFTATGTARLAGVEQTVRIAGGAVDENGRLALSLRMQPAGQPVSLAFEGSAVLSANRPRFAGQFTAESLGDTPWSIRSAIAADTSILTLDDGRIIYGPQNAPLELSASAFYAFEDDEPLSVALAAQQIDLDRIHRIVAGEDAPQAPTTVVAAPAGPPSATLDRLLDHTEPLIAGLTSVVGPDLEATANLDIGTVLAGGSLVRDVSVAARVRYGRYELTRAEALFPGDTQVEVSGRLEDGFTGRVAIQSARPSLLARWWTGRPASGLVLDPLLLEADVEVDGGALSARRVDLRLGDSTASGRARFRKDTGNTATLDVALSAPLVDASDVIDAGRLLRAFEFGLTSDTNVLLDVAAERLRLGTVEGDSLTLDAVYRDDTLTLHALYAEDLAGARILASGDIAALTENPVGTIEGTVELAEGDALAKALISLFPGNETAEQIAGVMPELAPGRLAITFSGRPAGPSPDLSMNVDGTLAGTQVSMEASGAPFSADWRQRPAFLALEAAHPDAAVIARQVGLPAGEEPYGAPGTIRVEAGGVPAEGLESALNVSAGEADVSWQGRVTLDGSLSLAGEAAVDIARLQDLAPLVPRPLPAAGDVMLTAAVNSEADGSLALRDLQGTVAGVAVSGALSADEDGLAGSLSVAQMDLAALVTLALGPGALDPAGDAPWPDRAFGRTLLPSVPVTLSIAAEKLGAERETLRDARFDLLLLPDRLEVADLSADAAGGTVSGNFALSRTGARANLEAAIALEDAAVRALVWQRDGEPVATGRADLSARVKSSGFSVANIVSGLSGEGRLVARDGRLVGINTDPFPMLARALDSDTPPSEDELASTFKRHLDDGTVPYERFAADLSVQAGAVRLSDAVVETDAAVELGSALVDLGAWRLASDWTIEVPLPDGETAAAGLTLRGPLAEPERTVDVASLASWLSLKQLERQVEAVERQNEELAAEAAALDPTLPDIEALDEAATPEEGEPAADAPAANAGRAADEGAGLAPSDATERPPEATDPATATTPVPVPEPSPPVASDDAARIESASPTGATPMSASEADVAVTPPFQVAPVGPFSATADEAPQRGEPQLEDSETTDSARPEEDEDGPVVEAASVADTAPPARPPEDVAAQTEAANRPAKDRDGQQSLAEISDQSAGAGTPQEGPRALAEAAPETPDASDEAAANESAVVPAAHERTTAAESPERLALIGDAVEATAQEAVGREDTSPGELGMPAGDDAATPDEAAAAAGDDEDGEAAANEGSETSDGDAPMLGALSDEEPGAQEPNMRPDGTIVDGSDPIGKLLQTVDDAVSDLQERSADQEARRQELLRSLGIAPDDEAAPPFRLEPQDGEAPSP